MKRISGTFIFFLLALSARAGEVSITTTNYHDWPNSIVMSNGKAEVVIVPQVGRIMQFRVAGEADGPFFENPKLFGQFPDPAATEWMNFGGDKTWPAPQSEWPKIAPRAWPPPSGFDSQPTIAEVRSDYVLLRSPVDPTFGIRYTREIRLTPDEPEMTIKTTYYKVAGDPQKVAVWVITQLKHPDAVYIPLTKSAPAPGYLKQSDALPAGLQRTNSLLSLQRDPKQSTKIGTEAETLVWADLKYVVAIKSLRVTDGEYPDNGSSAEVYTNPDPLPYVELELLGPLKTLRPRDELTQTSTYRIAKRGTIEARRILRPLGVPAPESK